MSQEPKPCAECGGKMEAGFVLDKTGAAFMAPRWIQGEPPVSDIGPDVAGWQYSAKGRECRRVITYRCEECGSLRSYAVEEVDPPSLFRA